jgi:hypothetical protein
MSFETLKVSELKQIAEDFAVTTDGLKNKADIIAALSEEGVTWSVYQQTLKNIDENLEEIPEVAPKFDPKAELSEDTVLVRMTRANYRFVAMKREKAQWIFDKEAGFRLATPKEVQEFYG